MTHLAPIDHIGCRAAIHGAPLLFRISRIEADLWTVTRPDAQIEHGFSDLAQAVAFIRRESGDSPATVELRVDDLYVVGYHDPRRPGPLFGEPA